MNLYLRSNSNGFSAFVQKIKCMLAMSLFYRFKCFLLLIFQLIFGVNYSTIHAQDAVTSPKGKEFWLAYMQNLDLPTNGNPSFSVWIHGDKNTSGTITVFGSAVPINFTVEAGKTTRVSLPNRLLYPLGSDVKKLCGVYIKSNDDIDVVALHTRVFFSESSRILPITQIASEYRVLATAGNPSGISNFVVCATEDNTEIEITPSADTDDGKLAGNIFTVTLNKGEVYQLQSAFNLSGTKVLAKNNKKIAVFGGAKTAYINISGCFGTSADSHVWEQNPPTNYFNTEFFLVPIINHGPMPFTIVTADGKTAKVQVNGQQIEVNGVFEGTLTRSAYIVSDKPIGIAFFMKSLGCNVPDTLDRGDPSMFIAAPRNCTEKFFTFSTLNNLVGKNQINPEFFAQVIVPTNYVNTLKLDGDPIRKNYIKTFFNNSSMSYCELILDSGTHTLECDTGIQGYVMAAGFYDAISYGLNGPGVPLKMPQSNNEEFSGDLKIKVYPVPLTSGNIKVKYLLRKVGVDQFAIVEPKYELFDEIGKLIYKNSSKITTSGIVEEIPAENLAPAIYYLRITINKEPFIFKVMKL